MEKKLSECWRLSFYQHFEEYFSSPTKYVGKCVNLFIFLNHLDTFNISTLKHWCTLNIVGFIGFIGFFGFLESLIYLIWMTTFWIDLKIFTSCCVVFKVQIKLKLIINKFDRIYETMQNKYHKYNHKIKRLNTIYD